MRLVVFLSVMLLLVVSCGQGNSPVEKQEKQAGVEQAQGGTQKIQAKP
jgi:ABC-type Fe3+-citrate transport system substrate-binding protein